MDGVTAPAGRVGGRRPAPAKWRAPWQTKRGGTDALRLVAFIGALLPGLVLAAQYAADDLGSRPVKELYLGAGLWSLRFLLISLAVTPARYLFDWPRVISLRRMLGLTALAYAAVHLVIYTASEQWRVPFVVSEIVNRIYLTIGFVALVGLCVLGATSFDSTVRRMGKRWKRLHKIVFAIGVLGALHYYMQTKANVTEAVLVSGYFVWLMLWRLIPAEWRRHPAALFALAPVAALATAGLELAWYGLATHIRVSRVIALDLTWPDDWDTLRPAHWVAVTALGVAVLSIVVRAVWRMLEASAARRLAATS